VATPLSTWLETNQLSASTTRGLNEFRDQQRNTINDVLERYRQNALSLAATTELTKLMSQANRYRLRRLDSPIIDAPTTNGESTSTLDLSQARPFESYVNVWNNQRTTAELDAVALQLRGPDGKILGQSSNFVWAPSNPTLVFRAMKQKSVVFDALFDTAAGKHLAAIAPIRSSTGRLIGVLVAEFPLEPVLRAVNSLPKTPGSYSAYVVQRAGLTPLSTLPAGTAVDSDAEQSFTAGDELVINADESNGFRQLSMSSLSLPDLGLVTSTPVTDSAALISTLKISLLTAIVATLVILAAGWFLIMRPFDQRLGRIAAATDKLVRRDYQLHLNDTTRDHAGVISRHLDQIAGEINEGVTVQLAVKEHIENLTDRDELTGLYNQEFALAKLKQLEDQPNALPVSLVALKLNTFKDIYATHGNTISDQILIAVARRIRSALDYQHFTARQKGGEFLIIAENTDRAGLQELVDCIQRIFTTSFETSAGEMLLNCELGTATAVEACDIHAALVRAENQDVQEDQAGAIEAAIREKRISVCYQPIVKLVSGAAPQMVAAEALVRVCDAAGKIIPPNTFMQQIQNTPSGLVLDRFVLQRASETVNQWAERKQIPDDFKLSVNLSRQSVQNTGIVGFVRNHIISSGLEPERITLEISGGTQELNVDVLTDLRELGLTLAMDDLGLQYTNIEQLISIQPAYAKIDQHRMRSENDAAVDHQIRSQLDTIWKSLGMEIIAKSVESADQIAELAGRGISLFQGFLFDQPRDGDSFIENWGLSDNTSASGDPTGMRKAS